MAEITERAARTTERVKAFMDDHVIPSEALHYEQLRTAENRWSLTPVMRELKTRARQAGLWMFPLPERLGGMDLSIVECAPVAEQYYRSPFGSEVFNCYSGTISNVKIIDAYGTEEAKARFIPGVLAGEKRSCISITERDVPSSDPTDLKFSIRRDGDSYVLNGHKSWATGAITDVCDAIMVLGCTDPEAERHKRHSLVLVPRDAPGLSIGRVETIYGYDHAPWGHVDLHFDDVRVPASYLLGQEGAGFSLMQATLGYGRIQLAMNGVGAAERAMSELCAWAEGRIIGGKPLADRGVVTDAIARSRMEIDQVRALVMYTAELIDREGVKAAKSEIAQCKVVAPNMALTVLDRAIQFHGGAGLSFDTPLAELWVYQRCTRIGEGADEVHRDLIARMELANQRAKRGARLEAAQ